MKKIIEKLATLENAKAWHNTSEQFTYCIDLLEISAWADNAERLVDRLEMQFEKLLKEAS